MWVVGSRVEGCLGPSLREMSVGDCAAGLLSGRWRWGVGRACAAAPRQQAPTTSIQLYVHMRPEQQGLFRRCQCQAPQQPRLAAT